MSLCLSRRLFTDSNLAINTTTSSLHIRIVMSLESIIQLRGGASNKKYVPYILNYRYYSTYPDILYPKQSDDDQSSNYQASDTPTVQNGAEPSRSDTQQSSITGTHAMAAAPEPHPTSRHCAEDSRRREVEKQSPIAPTALEPTPPGSDRLSTPSDGYSSVSSQIVLPSGTGGSLPESTVALPLSPPRSLSPDDHDSLSPPRTRRERK